MKRVLLTVLSVFAAGGCGTPPQTVFPHSIIGSDGTPIVLDDVEAIVRDLDLTEDEKREQLRELGIEDEELIEALLTL